MEVCCTGVSPDTERSGPAVLIGGGATALLWRAVLAGYPTDALPWGPVRDYFDRVGPRLGDAFRALWDGYAAVTYAAAGDEAGYRGLEERLAGADPARYPQAAPVILPLARAVWAFARGDFDAAATALEALAPDLVRIGGSNEQRDTFDDTVVAAHVRAGRYESAERLLRARLGRRPSLWLAEALAATGRRADAAEHLRRAPEGWATADPEGPERSALHRVQAAAAAEGEIPSAGEVTAKSG